MKINETNADEFIDVLRERWNVPGVAIGIRIGDEEKYICSGLSCIEKGNRFDEATIVPVGSVTKSFVADAASRLVKEGLFEWDVPVTRYVKDLKFADPVIQQEATLVEQLRKANLAGGRRGADRSQREFVRVGADANDLARCRGEKWLAFDNVRAACCDARTGSAFRLLAGELRTLLGASQLQGPQDDLPSGK